MSRVAKNPIIIPAGVEVSLNGDKVLIKGAKGSLGFDVPAAVKVSVVELAAEESNTGKKEKVISLQFDKNDTDAKMNAGTTRAILNNIVKGVSQGFEIQLELVGVGYRAQAKGKSIGLSLGFSHPIDYKLPDGVTAETPTNTLIILKSFNKQLLGQVAAEIRSFRPPEPYKGKGIKFVGEVILRKETKKK